MNRRAIGRVGDWIRRAFALMVITCSSCVQIDGGAVELSWAVFDFGGDGQSCVAAGISEVNLCWQASDGLSSGFVCESGSSHSFECETEQGSTAFEVPPGPTSLWIEVTCGATAQRAIEGTYQVPAPIVRTVRDGEIVSLNSLLIVATERGGEPSSTCPDF